MDRWWTTPRLTSVNTSLLFPNKLLAKIKFPISCAVMEAIHPRLKEALTPEMRGGVYGRVLQGGSIAIGATVTIREPGS